MGLKTLKGIWRALKIANELMETRETESVGTGGSRERTRGLEGLARGLYGLKNGPEGPVTGLKCRGGYGRPD